MPQKRLLQGRIDLSLYGLDTAPGHLAQWRQAGTDGRAVQQHGAGTAIARVAANLGAAQAQVFAQDLGQAARRIGGQHMPLTVHRQGAGIDGPVHGAASAPTSPATARRNSSVAAWAR